MALTRECGSGFIEVGNHSLRCKTRSSIRGALRAGRDAAASSLMLALLAMLALLPALSIATEQAHAASPDAAVAAVPGNGAARLALLPPLVGTGDGVRRHDHAGVALEGFDPVTYFLGDGPRPGEAMHEAVWNGHAWRFASAANRAAFLSRPEVYAPRLGGNDALAMSEGRVVEAQARIAAIVDGHLYLFHTRAARDAFLDDPGAASRAERIWREGRERMARL